MLIKNAYVYRNTTRSFERMDISVKNGKIFELGDQLASDDEAYDAGGAFLLPGLVDVHTHGRAGHDFLNADSTALGKMAIDYARHGVTTVMPTMASATWQDMLKAVEQVNAHQAMHGESELLGAHLEGRYLSAHKKGAHAEELLAPLVAEELDDHALRMCDPLHITAAYELDGDGSFSKKALSMGATLGLGHTNATYKEAVMCESRGVTSYTHLFNAMPSLHHRDGGAVCAALMGKCFGELICDGIHISPEMIKMAYSMLGCERTVLISDSMEAAGCADGEYSIAGNKAIVKNGIALTESGALAGSTLTLDEAVRNLMLFCHIPLTEAILCATQNPAKQIGAFDSRGSIDIGKRADILFVRDTATFDIEKVMINGRFI